MEPPERADDLAQTYIHEAALGQLAVPLVLDLLDLALLVEVDVDDTSNGLLFADALDGVLRLEVHGDGVAG